MKHYGLDIPEGTSITNITVPSGAVFPINDNIGELFFKTDLNKLYIRNNTSWVETLTIPPFNATTLEGQAGAYYLDLNNSTGILSGGTF